MHSVLESLVCWLLASLTNMIGKNCSCFFILVSLAAQFYVEQPLLTNGYLRDVSLLASFAGVLGSVSMAIITDLFSFEQRGRVMGFVQMAFALARWPVFLSGFISRIYLTGMPRFS
jgi:MFS family permease